MEFTRNLFIGLGGTGQRILLEAKRSIMRANGGQVPPQIQFVIIDTDTSSSLRDSTTGENVVFRRGEYIRLPGDGAVSVAQKASNDGWWPTDCVDWPLPGPGAAAKRMHGRAKLGLSISLVKNKIKDAVSRCRHTNEEGAMDERGGAVSVTIACSLAGGTGGGTWMDVANLVHPTLALGANDKLTGLLVLGDAFDGLPGTRNKNANTYASLRELQWLMEDHLAAKIRNSEYTLGEETLQFPNSKIFTDCFLIMKRNKLGLVVGKPEHIFRGLGRFLFHSAGEHFDKLRANMNNATQNRAYGEDGTTKRMGCFWSIGISELSLEVQSDDERLHMEWAAGLLAELTRPSGEREAIGIDDPSKFLDSIQLQEDDRDDVIDRLFSPADLAAIQKRYFDLPNGDTLDRKGAYEFAMAIQKLCSMRVPGHVRTKAEKQRSLLFQEAEGHLRARRDELLCQVGGIPRARDFFHGLKSLLSELQSMMATEAEEDREKASRRRNAFNKILRGIPKESKGFMWKGGAIANMESIRPDARAWLENEIDVARKQAAAGFYLDLEQTADRIVSEIEAYERQIRLAMDNLRSQASRLKRKERSSFIRVLPPSGRTSAFDQLAVATDFVEHNSETITGKWCSAECDPSEIESAVVAFVAARAHGKADRSIEDWLEDKDQTELNREVEELLGRASPLWHYQKKVVQPDSTTEFILVTADGHQDPNPKLKKSIDALIDPNKYEWSENEGANSLSMIVIENNVPGYALECVSSMARDYFDDNLWYECGSGFHLHKDWRKILPTLAPDREQEERKINWLICQAVGSGGDSPIIKNTGRTWLVMNDLELGHTQEDGRWYHQLDARTYIQAREEVISNRELSSDLNTSWMVERRRIGLDPFMDLLKKHRAQLSDMIDKLRGDDDRKAVYSEDLRILNAAIDSKLFV